MPNYLSRMKPNGADGTEYKLKDEELREVVQTIQDEVAGTQTATGNPITLTDVSETYAQGLSVELEPKQDLHGYDFPWVRGSQKNKMFMTLASIKAANTDGTWSGNVYSLNNVTFTIESDDGGNVTGISFSTGSSGASANTTLEFFLPEKSLSELGLSENDNLILSGSPSGGGTTRFFLRFQACGTGSDILDYGNGAQGTIDSNSPRKGNIFVRSGYQGQNISFKPMLRLSTETDPTFAPYSNICPISGYDGVEVEDVGKNLLAPTEYNGEYNKAVGGDLKQGTAQQYSIDDNGTLSIVNTVEWHGRLFATGVLRQGNYRIPTQTFGDGNIRASIIVTDEDLIVKRNIANRTVYGQHNSITITVQDGERIAYVANASIAETFTITNFYLYAEDEFVEQYEPHQSRTASVTFGQTVYGGSVDVTNGGTESAFGNNNDISQLDWVEESVDGLFRVNVTNDNYKYMGQLFCDRYKGVQKGAYADMNYGEISVTNAQALVLLRIKDATAIGMTKEQFKTHISGTQLTYELYESTQLSTPPTDLKLLQDTNNLTTNGTTITLDYIPNNSIGDAVKASEEYTDRAVEGKADNTTAYVDLPGNYDTTNKNFPTRSATSGSVENCLTYINDLADKLYTAINSHATALANIPSKTVLYDDVVEVSDEFNIFIPSSYNYLIFELNISSSSYYGTGSLIVTSLDNTLNILTTSHDSVLRTCTLMFNQNRVEVGGDFDQEIGELKITAF